MYDEDEATFSFSQIRQRIQEQINLATDGVKSPEKPPIPRHRPKPLNGHLSPQNGNARQKPPLLPKPAHLTRKSELSPTLGRIKECNSTDGDDFETPRFSGSIPDLCVTTPSVDDLEAGTSVESGGMTPRRSIPGSWTTGCSPGSDGSSDTNARSGSDTESEPEEQTMMREPRGRTRRSESAVGIFERRVSSSLFYTDSTLSMSSMHEKIVDELIQKKIIRESRRNMGKSEKALKRASSSLSENSSNVDSGSTGTASQRHSQVVDETAHDYDVGDPIENRRLRDLHNAALEFLTVEKKFCKWLNDMALVYPSYLREYAKGINRELLPDEKESPVERVRVLLLQILPVHEKMLADFQENLANWDSRNPNLARLIKSMAPFLKVCKPYLLEKTQLAEDMRNLARHHDFNKATGLFEQKILGYGPGAVVQQLDQVHQNFLRYKLLMSSYVKYLPADSEELVRANEVVTLLEKVAQDVNKDLDTPSCDAIWRLAERFGEREIVFEKGHHFINETRVQKQTRNDRQPRVLVLFSDCLWICREGTGCMFNMKKSFKLALDTTQIELPEHQPFHTQLNIQSPIKSCAVLFEKRSERDAYAKILQGAIDARISHMRRVYAGNRRASIANGVEPDDRTAEMLFERPALAPIEPFLPNKEPTLLQALWLPDHTSTRCLMDKCGTEFSLLNRRHHCRECGWLICSRCLGRAPIQKLDYVSKNVCPECYGRIFGLYRKGILFPEQMLVRDSSNPDLATGVYLKGKECSMDSLFREPQHANLKRLDINARFKGKDGTVFGSVVFRDQKGKESEKFAQLEDYHLSFFAAIFDEKPEYKYFIHGYYLKEEDLDSSCGAVFWLRHQNQFHTDRRDEATIVFRVDSLDERKKWSDALNKLLHGEANGDAA